MYDTENWEDYVQVRYQDETEVLTVDNDVRFNPDEDVDYIKCDTFVKE